MVSHEEMLNININLRRLTKKFLIKMPTKGLSRKCLNENVQCKEILNENGH